MAYILHLLSKMTACQFVRNPLSTGNVPEVGPRLDLVGSQGPSFSLDASASAECGVCDIIVQPHRQLSLTPCPSAFCVEHGSGTQLS